MPSFISAMPMAKLWQANPMTNAMLKGAGVDLSGKQRAAAAGMAPQQPQPGSLITRASRAPQQPSGTTLTRGTGILG